jgi:hypothetical protein
MKRRLLLIGLLLLFSGCAADVKLRHPATRTTAVCEGGYPTRGIAGLTNQTAKDLQFRCIDDYARQGYERVPN